ncbi:MAG: PTS sugar transporter subunit IIA [Candidatus Krumholzibacteriales bacterium]
MESKKLIDHFDKDLCLFNLRSKKKFTVLNEMVQHLVSTGKVTDAGLIMEMLRNRENLGSTGLGKGVAFPHGKSVAIKELTVLFGRSPYGIDFDAADSKDVYIFFLILAPTDSNAETYLELLSDLLGIIKQPDKLKRLHEIKNFESLKEVLGG